MGHACDVVPRPCEALGQAELDWIQAACGKNDGDSLCCVLGGQGGKGVPCDNDIDFSLHELSGDAQIILELPICRPARFKGQWFAPRYILDPAGLVGTHRTRETATAPA